ncbi:MAG: aminodeoxychorismate/anthranilate synthase component II [Alphaproteobacteria bacterium]|nr:aminodeoxychorismate/anthranilate synthase component II [Alphaproteobacteria bacterium]
MILIIDNYDSFVYTLAGYVKKLGRETRVIRNDALPVEDILDMKPEAVILSPGPSTPQKAGICIELIGQCGSTIPILGICLGHQAIGEAYGGKTVHSNYPMHGKSEALEHDSTGIFENIQSPIIAGRYHSLVTEIPESSDLVVTIKSPNGEIMAIRHKNYPVYGLQFHPESVLTHWGLDLMKNFLHIADEWNKKDKDGNKTFSNLKYNNQ